MGLFLPLGKGSCSFLSWASEISFPLCGFPSMHHLLAWEAVTLHGVAIMEPNRSELGAQRYLGRAEGPLDFSLC